MVLDILSKAIHPKLKLLGHLQKSLSQVQYTLEGSFLAQPFRQIKNRLASGRLSCTSSKTYVHILILISIVNCGCQKYLGHITLILSLISYRKPKYTLTICFQIILQIYYKSDATSGVLSG